MSAMLLAGLLVLSPIEASAKGAAAAPSSKAKEVTWMRPFRQGQWALTAAVIEATPEARRTPRAWLYLARARERQNHLVEALDIYERLSDQAPSGRGIQHVSADVRARAMEEAAALARRIPWADIEVPGDLPQGTYVFVDNRWLEPVRLRSPYPVNPGWHTFLLEVDGQVRAAERVHFEEGQQRPVLLWLERLTVGGKAVVPDEGRKVPVPAPPSRPKAASPSSPAPRAAPRTLPISWSAPEGEANLEASRKRTLRLTSYVGLGMGALGVGLGGGYTLDAMSKRDDLSSLRERCGECNDPADLERRRQLESGAQRSASVATLGFIVGGASVIGGGVLYLLSQEDDEQATSLASSFWGVDVEPVVGVGGGGVSGRF